MGQLVNGEWITDDEFLKETEFERSETDFRNRVEADPEAEHPVEPDRYHLYISRACPWAHRTAILRRLKGLEESVGLSIVDPYMGEDGWVFSEGEDCVPDTVNGCEDLKSLYRLAEPDYTGRVTVPVLWDKKRDTIVNNESKEIIRMFDVEFDPIAQRDNDFYPDGLRDTIEETIDRIYEPINNGVYRAGFTADQSVYDEVIEEMFEELDYWEDVLEDQRYLCGDVPTEADWCMFTTLYRFDAVYYSHFKCNVRAIREYPNLWDYTRDLYQFEDVSETCNMRHVKEHYYRSHESINPSGIVPIGPTLDFDAPHNRS